MNAPALRDVEDMRDRAWRAMGDHAFMSASLLLQGFPESALAAARRCDAADHWWREACQQVRDLRQVEVVREGIAAGERGKVEA